MRRVITLILSLLVIQPLMAAESKNEQVTGAHLALYSPWTPAHNAGHIWSGLVAAGISTLAWTASSNVRAGSRDFCRFIGIVYGLKAVFRFGGGH